MLAIVIGMLLVLAVAGWVIVTVARPNMYLGASVLTPEGERLTRPARRRARRAAATARTAASTASAAAATLRNRVPRRAATAAATPAEPPESVIDLDQADAVVHNVARRVEAGITARARAPRSVPDAGSVPGSGSGAGSVPPRQQGSPMATPAEGVSETMTR